MTSICRDILRAVWGCACSIVIIIVVGSFPVSTQEASDEDLKINFHDHDCMRIPKVDQILDWEYVFDRLIDWLERKPHSKTESAGDNVATSVGVGNVHLAPEVVAVKDLVEVVLDGEKRRQARSQCPLGMLCLCIFEATALVSMRTEEVEPHFQCVQEILAGTPIHALAGAKWPVFRMMHFLWTLNKIPLRQLSGYQNINRFVHRQYADLNFDPINLSPFGVGHVVPWNSWLWVHSEGSGFASQELEEMAMTSRSSYNGFSAALQGLASAVWQSVMKDGLPRSGRPLVRISLAFGSEWAELLPFSWARWGALGLRAHLFVAMDQAAVDVCVQFLLTCVPTGYSSILHKYTITTLALHLGVDVLYCDLDAVPLGPNPVGFAHDLVDDMGSYAGADLAVSTHNYDCLNAGVWYARSTPASAQFFLLLLEYLYDHWYEGDQRAFNAFATGNVSVSYESSLKKRLPALRVATLSPDVFAGSEGFEDVETVQVFHAYKIYDGNKIALMNELYGKVMLPPHTPITRSSIWQWGQDAAVQGHVRAHARRTLSQFVRTRSSKRCW